MSQNQAKIALLLLVGGALLLFGWLNWMSINAKPAPRSSQVTPNPTSAIGFTVRITASSGSTWLTKEPDLLSDNACHVLDGERGKVVDVWRSQSGGERYYRIEIRGCRGWTVKDLFRFER